MSKKKVQQVIVEPKITGIYTEDEWGRNFDVSDVELCMSLVRRRIDKMADWELHHLLQRIEHFSKDVPNMPMTQEQHENARRMINGFKSIFVVERRPEPLSE